MDKINYVSGTHMSDENNFRVLFEEHHRGLYCFAARYLPAAQGPEDVVQEAFIKLWQRRSCFRQHSTALAFLYTTIRNHCINICKHQQVVRRYSHYLHHNQEGQTIDWTINEAADNGSREKMYDALQILPLGCRKVIRLSYLQGMKNREIAKKLCISVNTVKTQKQRGLRVLRQVVI